MEYSRFVNPCENFADLALLRVLKSTLEDNEEPYLELYLQKAIMSYRINGTKMIDALKNLDELMNERLALKNGSLPVDAMVTMVSPENIEILLPNDAVGTIPLICIPKSMYNRETRTIEYQKEKIAFGDIIKAILCEEEHTSIRKSGKTAIYKFIR